MRCQIFTWHIDTLVVIWVLSTQQQVFTGQGDNHSEAQSQQFHSCSPTEGTRLAGRVKVPSPVSATTHQPLRQPKHIWICILKTTFFFLIYGMDHQGRAILSLNRREGYLGVTEGRRGEIKMAVMANKPVCINGSLCSLALGGHLPPLAHDRRQGSRPRPSCSQYTWPVGCLGTKGPVDPQPHK